MSSLSKSQANHGPTGDANMLYFKTATNSTTDVVVTAITSEYTADCISRWDIQSFDHANRLAVAATIFDPKGGFYIATDAGEYVSPRYDVIAVPTVGSAVSGCFNGDSYPEGVITKISKSLRRVETSTGAVFYRKRQTGCWVSNGTWSMVSGHRNERNPSF
jgi:hypothetical protein